MSESHFPPERRAEARARCDAASPGPWVWRDGYDSVGGKPHPPTEPIESGWYGPNLEAVIYGVWRNDNYADADATDADKDFLNHVRADLPAALAELNRLDAEIERLRAENAELRNKVAGFEHVQDLWSKGMESLDKKD